MIPAANRTAIALALFALPLGAQTPAPDPTLGDKLKELRSMLKDRRMEQDFLAISLVQKLTAEPDKLNPKDETKILKALAKVYRTGRLRPPDKAQLYQETADAIAKFREDGGPVLLKCIEDSRIKGRDYARLRAYMIRALGRTKDERQIEWLTEEALRSPDNVVMAAAGEALGNFTTMKIKRRREVVKDLVGRWGEWHMQSTALESSDPNAPIDFGPQNARETLSHIEGPWRATLQRLTGQAFSSAPEWQHWLNKNKNWEPPK